MKNQYFGDKRDLLKYSLLETVMEQFPGLEQLTCIWMLTPPSERHDGSRTFVAHAGREALADFLLGRVASGRRDVGELSKYFAERPFTYFSYGERASEYFTSANRDLYFQGIPGRALRKSAVLFDPDNGLEPARIITPAHLRYSELVKVFGRMDEHSIAVIYQHLPRRKATVFWPAIANRLTGVLDAEVGFVAAGDVALYIALKSAARRQYLEVTLEEFRRSWPGPVAVGFGGK